MSCLPVRSPPSGSGGEEVLEEGRAWAGCGGCHRPGRRRQAEGWDGRGLPGQALGMEHWAPAGGVGGGGVAELGGHPEPGGGQHSECWELPLGRPGKRSRASGRWACGLRPWPRLWESLVASGRRSCCWKPRSSSAGLSLTAAGHLPDLVVLEGERRSRAGWRSSGNTAQVALQKISVISWVEIVLDVLRFMTQDDVGARKLISKIRSRVWALY